MKKWIEKRKRTKRVKQRAKAMASILTDLDEGFTKFVKTVNNFTKNLDSAAALLAKKRNRKSAQIVVDSRKWTGRY